jgi:hypothetical protein
MPLTRRTVRQENPLTTRTITKKAQVRTYALARAGTGGRRPRCAPGTGSLPGRLGIQVAKDTGTLLLLICNG